MVELVTLRGYDGIPSMLRGGVEADADIWFTPVGGVRKDSGRLRLEKQSPARRGRVNEAVEKRDRGCVREQQPEVYRAGMMVGHQWTNTGRESQRAGPESQTFGQWTKTRILFLCFNQEMGLQNLWY